MEDAVISPTKDEFVKMTKQFNLVPVFRELTADTETPISIFKKVRGPESFLLESIEGGERWGRYSFIGYRPRLVIKAWGEQVEQRANHDKPVRFKGKPLVYLERVMKDFRAAAVPGLPRFFGGLVGFMSYDMVRFFEELPSNRPNDLGTPDAAFMMPEQVVIYDNLTQTIKVVVNCYVTDKVNAADAYDDAVEQIDKTEQLIRQASATAETHQARMPDDLTLTPNMNQERFQDIVTQAKQYITQGDAIQIVLSQRFHTDITTEPFQVYRALRRVNPSPYMYYLQFNGETVVGASPEVLVRLENDRVALRPIAGTRPRGADKEEDQRLEEELRADPKEKAEHVMLVDLGRNDVGRVATVGTVEVKDLMIVERYSHVMHLVSHVEGDLAPGLNMFDVLRASFPAGTVSGAPKVRAMEIIDELEPTRRGLYAGAVGYFGFSGNMDFCIAIRTLLVQNGRVYLQVGAGIVADSDPALEYQETVNKGKALVRALEMANNGLV
jgi:anthranilate synthase component 1